MASLCEYDVFDVIPSSELLLEGDVLLSQLLAVFLLNIFEGILVQDLRSLIFTLSLLKLCELDEELLVEGSLAKLSQGSFKHKSCSGMVPLVFFKVGSLHIALRHWVCVNIPFVYCSAIV